MTFGISTVINQCLEPTLMSWIGIVQTSNELLNDQEYLFVKNCDVTISNMKKISVFVILVILKHPTQTYFFLHWLYFNNSTFQSNIYIWYHSSAVRLLLDINKFKFHEVNTINKYTYNFECHKLYKFLIIDVNTHTRLWITLLFKPIAQLFHNHCVIP